MIIAQKVQRSDTAAVPESRSRNMALWVAQVLLAVAAAGAGLSKLMAAPEMVAMFETIGVGQWFRVATGAIEVGGAVLLLIPALAGFGGLILSGVFVGAAVTEQFVLEGSILRPLPLLVLATLVAVGRWGRTRRMLGR